MVDVITCGFWVIQALAENPSIKVSIYVHRTMHGAFTEDPCHGIATLLLIKLVRMVELDALYIGIISIGKMISGMTEDDNLRACLGIDVPYKAVMPVCSGGIYSGLMADIVRLAGTNV